MILMAHLNNDKIDSPPHTVTGPGHTATCAFTKLIMSIEKVLQSEIDGTSIKVFECVKGSPIPSRTLVATFYHDAKDDYHKPNYMVPIPQWAAEDYFWFKTSKDPKYNQGLAEKAVAIMQSMPLTKDDEPAAVVVKKRPSRAKVNPLATKSPEPTIPPQNLPKDAAKPENRPIAAASQPPVSPPQTATGESQETPPPPIANEGGKEE